MAIGNRISKISGSGSGRYETSYGYSARNELGSLDRYQVVEEWNEETQEYEEVWYFQGGYSYAYDLRGNLVQRTYYADDYYHENESGHMT